MIYLASILVNWEREDQDQNSCLIENKSLMLGRIEERRRRVHRRIRWLDGITDSMDMNLGKHWEMVKDREPWYATVHGLERVGDD